MSLTTLLLLSSGSAYGEWVVVEKPNRESVTQTVYVDLDTIPRKGKLVSIWYLIDYHHSHQLELLMGVSSSKTRKQFDCANKLLRWLACIEFSGHMGAGLATNKDVDKDNWYPVEPVSLDHALWKVACAKM